MAATKKATKPAKEVKPLRNNFNAKIEDKDAVAAVAEALGYMVQRGRNAGLRGSIEGLINAIGAGEVAVVKIVPQDEGPIPGHLEQYIKALNVAHDSARRAKRRAKENAHE